MLRTGQHVSFHMFWDFWSRVSAFLETIFWGKRDQIDSAICPFPIFKTNNFDDYLCSEEDQMPSVSLPLV